jgi:hypothetical protein
MCQHSFRTVRARYSHTSALLSQKDLVNELTLRSQYSSITALSHVSQYSACSHQVHVLFALQIEQQRRTTAPTQHIECGQTHLSSSMMVNIKIAN